MSATVMALGRARGADQAKSISKNQIFSTETGERRATPVLRAPDPIGTVLKGPGFAVHKCHSPNLRWNRKLS